MSRNLKIFAFVLLLSVIIADGQRMVKLPCCGRMSPDDLVQVRRYSFSPSRVRQSVCPTIANEASSFRGILLQPNNTFPSRLNGCFFIPESIWTTGLFSISHNQYNCSSNSDVQCDLLFISPVMEMIASGEFLIQYRPPSASNTTISFIYGPEGIFFNGSTSNVTVGQSGLQFLFRPSDQPTNQFNVCEENIGSITTQTQISPSRDFETCIIADGELQSLFTVQVTFPSIQGTKEIRLVKGGCDSPIFKSAPINATFLNTSSTPTMSTTSTTAGTTTGSPDNIILIVVMPIALIVIIIGVIFIIICCKCCNHRCQSKSLEIAGLQSMQVDTLKDIDDKGDKDMKSPTAIPNDYAMFPLVSSTGSEQPVSSVAFVTAEDGENYQELMRRLESLHDCDRVKPFSASVVGSDKPSQTDYHQGISQCLRREKCLVYIIWSGALESLNGNQCPPIKTLIRSLMFRPLRNVSSKSVENVMYKLILLQLGSKGNNRFVSTSLNSTHIFWEGSPGDSDFDAQKCAEHVHGIVMKKLEGVKSEKLVTQKTTSSHSFPPSNGSLSQDAFLKIVDSKLDAHAEKIKKHITSEAKGVKEAVDCGFENINEKIDDSNLA